MNGKYTIDDIKKISCLNYSKKLNMLSNSKNQNKIKTHQETNTPPLYLCARKTVPYKKVLDKEITNQSEMHINSINDEKKITRCIKTVPFNKTNLDNYEVQKGTQLKEKRPRSDINENSPIFPHSLRFLSSKYIDNSDLLSLKKFSSKQEDNNSDKDNCFICNWRFPRNMVMEEKEAHLNKCLDNQGTFDKNNYFKSIKEAKEIEKVFQSEMTETICPFCFKQLPFNQERHKKWCSNQIINK